jgi:DNA polymerase-1
MRVIFFYIKHMIYLISNQKRLYLDDIQQASIEDCLDYFKDKDELQVDTETESCPWDKPIKRKTKGTSTNTKERLPDPYTSKVLLLQLGDFNNQFVIEGDINDYRKLKPLLEDTTKLKLLANGFFDIRFFWHWGVQIKNVYDVFLAEHIINRGKDLPKGYRSLESMALRYANVKLNKDIRGQIHWRGADDTVIRYAAEDVKYMQIIRDKQLPQLEEAKLLEYLRLENRYVIDLAEVSYRGMRIDTEKWLEVERENKEKLKTLHLQLNQWVIENKMYKFISNTLFGKTTPINWSSSDQVTPLFKELGIDTTVQDKETGEDKDSVELKHIKKQSGKSSILPIYIQYKETHKEITTYGAKFLEKNLNPKTGRIHSEFFQILETGRVSSNKPNCQNIPGTDDFGHTHPLRLAFVPTNGNTYVIADYSQQEPRITAEYSQDPYLIDFILHGSGDSHGLVASMLSEYLLGEHIEVTKENDPMVPQFGKTIRAIGKTINLGRDYGKSAFTTAPDLGISVEETEALFKVIEDKTPKKKEYFQKCQRYTEQHGYIITENVFYSRTYFDGYPELQKLKAIPWEQKTKADRRRYYQLKGSMERFSQNNRIQGTAALMTKLAHIYFNNELDVRGYRGIVYVVNLIHDEIIAECPVELAEEIKILLQESMEKAGRVFCKTIPIKADPLITMEWKH